MSSSNGEWRTPAFRQKVILQIDEVLKKCLQKERSAQEIEQQIFEKANTRESYMTIVARIILAFTGAGNQTQGQTPKPSNSASILDTNMQPSPMSNQEGLRNDNAHSLPKPSPMASLSTPSPKVYQSLSPATVQPGKQSKTSQIKTTQVSYLSPSPLVPSPGPAGPSPAPEVAPASGIPSVDSPGSFNPPSNQPSTLSTRVSGIPSVESPGSFNPPSNPGSQESPVKLSDKDEQLYMDKLKQLSVYIEPLRKMIAKLQNDEADAANRDSTKLTKLKRLLSILGNSRERFPYQTLLKVENVLVRRLDLHKAAAPIGHSLLDALQAKADSPQSNNTLYRMFAPTLATINGPPICPPAVPRHRRERTEPKSALPHAVKSEIAQLADKFTVDYANDTDEACERMALVCSVNDKTLPAVPSLLVHIPQDYPYSSPYFDSKNYDSTEFLKSIRDRLKQKLSSFSRLYSFSTLLLNWESCVRYVDARDKGKSVGLMEA